ncbi:hypothetical protein NDU88_004993 [Pleurodeles waltl]|uniref:Secreted protein n=1 Tax=Pleurodeles waltl TaxID=8319 RepID=A0AAV7TUD1_PLEWA|nr:hypothetical protein NDU88_004993 [Pleurodeles waltl]
MPFVPRLSSFFLVASLGPTKVRRLKAGSYRSATRFLQERRVAFAEEGGKRKDMPRCDPLGPTGPSATERAEPPLGPPRDARSGIPLLERLHTSHEPPGVARLSPSPLR